MEQYTEVELPPETEKQLEALAQKLGLTKEEALNHAMELMPESLKSGEYNSFKSQKKSD